MPICRAPILRAPSYREQIFTERGSEPICFHRTPKKKWRRNSPRKRGSSMNDTISISKKTLKKIILLALVLIVVALGYHVFKGKEAGNHTEKQQLTSQSEKKEQAGKTGPAPAGHAHGLPARVESAGGGP